MDRFSSALKLNNLIFDEIEFKRIGLKNENDVRFSMQIQTGKLGDDSYRVIITLNGNKEDEYNFKISLSGFFSIDEDSLTANMTESDLINKNAVAIMMPYLRSELTLLTSQPEVDSIVLPPINISKMMDEKNNI